MQNVGVAAPDAGQWAQLVFAILEVALLQRTEHSAELLGDCATQGFAGSRGKQMHAPTGHNAPYDNHGSATPEAAAVCRLLGTPGPKRNGPGRSGSSPSGAELTHHLRQSLREFGQFATSASRLLGPGGGLVRYLSDVDDISVH